MSPTARLLVSALVALPAACFPAPAPPSGVDATQDTEVDRPGPARLPVSHPCFHGVVGGECDDANACTAFDRCSALLICAGEPAVCDDGDPCTVDSCDPTGAGCTAEQNLDAPDCDSWRPAPETCPQPGGPCVVSAWSPDAGACAQVDVAAGTPCGDLDDCTTGGTCDGDGACVAGATQTCEPSQPTCADSLCHSAAGLHLCVDASCTCDVDADCPEVLRGCVTTKCADGLCVRALAADGPDPHCDGDASTDSECVDGICSVIGRR